MIIVLGALLGLVSVAFGAYAEHGLRAQVTEEVFRSLMTAIRYNQVHAVLVVAVGLALLQSSVAPYSSLLVWVAGLFIAGTVLFSFAIYLAAVLDMTALTRLAPLGGLTLMSGWLLLAWVGVRSMTGWQD